MSEPIPTAPADTFSSTGVRSSFHGPYAGGPPPEALVVDAPALEHFGPAELRHMVLVGVVLATMILRSLAGWVLRRGHRSLVTATATGLVDAFEALGPTYVKL
ncbi:MAG: hypothetical protein ACYCS2_06370, partial [Acidimicrobiales bacterium]